MEHEAGGSDPSASAAAVETACRRLKGHLVGLLGSVGVSALLGRALHMAQRENPSLAEVAVSGEPGACFTGLAESLAARTDEEATSAAETVLTYVLVLLVMLLGEELGMKPVQKLWSRETSVKEIDE
ncbi:MAG TPA: hypothetical protein VMM12_09465 [Longimicrobiales bacterium]|nr:hypothetical protein [Longimicrobiales bacterium]